MAWTFVAGSGYYVYASGTISTTDPAEEFNIAIGDLLVVSVGWMDGVTPVACTTEDESFTMLTQTEATGGFCTHTLGYLKATVANAATLVTGTLTAARDKRVINVYQFRPDAGETVTLAAGPSAAVGTTTAIQSGNISPSGSDLLTIGGTYDRDDDELSSPQIADTAATASLLHNFGMIWYLCFTSGQTNIHAQCTSSYVDSWVCDIMAFESAAGAGGVSIPIIERMGLRGLTRLH